MKSHEHDRIIAESEVADLPVGHLRLGLRARKAVERFGSIGALVDGSLARNTWTASVRREIDSVIDKLAATLRKNGLAGWDEFRRSLPIPRDPDAGCSVYFMSPPLRKISEDAKRQHVSQLHLSVRSVNALERENINSVGALVERAVSGLRRLRAAGSLSVNEIHLALEALSTSLTSRGRIDWIKYAHARGFLILPVSRKSTWGGDEFLEQLPKILKRLMRIQFNAVSYRILNQRFLAGVAGPQTFDVIAREFGRTRQRMRIVEEDFVKMLRRVIWLDDYRGCAFRFRSEFLRPLKRLADKLEIEGILWFPSAEWSQMFIRPGCKFRVQREVSERVRPKRPGRDRKHLLAYRWTELVRELWHTEMSELDVIGRLILAVLGFSMNTSVSRIERVALRNNEKSAAIRSSFDEIQRLLTFVYPNGLTAKKLVAKLRANLSGYAPTKDECLTLIKSISDIESTPEGFYRARLTSLNRTKDRCERVLRDEGRILHFSELASQASVVSKTKGRFSLARILWADQRFVRVSRSGYWGLAEWNVETGSIADVAVAGLRQKGRALTETEIFQFVRNRRPCAEGSIGSTLVADRRFKRVGPLTWVLATKRHR